MATEELSCTIHIHFFVCARVCLCIREQMGVCVNASVFTSGYGIFRPFNKRLNRFLTIADPLKHLSDAPPQTTRCCAV